MAASTKPIHEEIVPILILVAVIAVVVSRLPKVDVGHTANFRRRRLMNWLPLGLTYAFLYMGRYNMTVVSGGGGSSWQDFGTIRSAGALTYGIERRHDLGRDAVRDIHAVGGRGIRDQIQAETRAVGLAIDLVRRGDALLDVREDRVL